MKKKTFCPTCGACTDEYDHVLAKSLARVIFRICQGIDSDRRFHVGSIGLTNPQINNLQKLRYWDIIAKEPDGEAKGGYWILTDTGLQFAQGRIPLRRKVWTYRGDVQRLEGAEVFIQELAGGWRYRPDYARDSLPHPQPPRDPNQPELPL